VPLFKIGPPKLEFDGDELALQDPDEEVSAPARGSKKRESMRSVSPLTRSSIASTIHVGVNTSPWSAIRCFDLIKFMERMRSGER